MDSFEEKVIAEWLDRKPSPYPRLLMHAGNELDVYLHRKDESASAFSQAYFQAAESFVKNPPQPLFDYQVLPVIFLYRHYVELALKECLESLLGLVHLVEPEFVPDAHARSVIRRHNIAALQESVVKTLRKYNEYAKESKAEKIEAASDQCHAFIAELADLDPDSYRFRYHVNKQGERDLPERLGLNLGVLSTGMQHVFRELSRLRNTTDIAANLLVDHLSYCRERAG